MFKNPDQIIYKDAGNKTPYMLRWFIIPKNRFFNIYVHKFLADDLADALHDHPWASCSIILRGGYLEHLPGGVVKKKKAPSISFRRASQAHRIELHRDYVGNHVKTPVVRSAWTIFITLKKVREWGFLCPKGWVHWKDFVDPEDEGKVGKGCNQ